MKILQESRENQDKVKECLKIAIACYIFNKDTEKVLTQLKSNVIEERLRRQEFDCTNEFITDLFDFSADAFMMLYAYKVDSNNFDIGLERDVVAEYKSGKGDPGKFFSMERIAK